MAAVLRGARVLAKGVVFVGWMGQAGIVSQAWCAAAPPPPPSDSHASGAAQPAPQHVLPLPQRAGGSACGLNAAPAVPVTASRLKLVSCHSSVAHVYKYKRATGRQGCRWCLADGSVCRSVVEAHLQLFSLHGPAHGGQDTVSTRQTQGVEQAGDGTSPAVWGWQGGGRE